MWATKKDLILRLGEKRVDELSTRYIYDEEASNYIGDARSSSRGEVIDTFLEDAKSWLLWQMSKCYGMSAKQIDDFICEDGKEFRVILIYHVKLTAAMMKSGGDCEDCEKCKIDFKELCQQTDICSEDGFCIERKARYSVTDLESCLPDEICYYCKKDACCCEH